MAVYKMTPSKGNLIKAKSSLAFARMGYDLLDKKRTVLIREMMGFVDKATKLQNTIEESFARAYEMLKTATITMGSEQLEQTSYGIEKEHDFDIITKSVMGVETPIILESKTDLKNEYNFYRTTASFDQAFLEMQKIKELIYRLTEVENSVFLLGLEIKKTQKRANALDKIQIPKYEQAIKQTVEFLEEKDREDFFRLKRVKSKKRKA